MFSLHQGPEQDTYESLLFYLVDKFGLKEILKIEKSPDKKRITIYAAYTQIILDKNKKEEVIFSTANGKYEEFKYGLYPLGSKLLATNKSSSEESLVDIDDISKDQIEEVLFMI
jgi:hypothetical protein